MPVRSQVEEWRPPPKEWAVVANRIKRHWSEKAPGIVAVSEVRAGKTTLVVNGIMPLVASTDRVVILDFKGDDPVLNQAPARGVRRIPKRMFRGTRRDRNQWWRIVIDDDVKRGGAQLDWAWDTIWAEGNFTVFVNEARALVGRQAPDYNRPTQLNRAILRGGYKGIRTCVESQTPSFVNRETLSQRSFMFAGAIQDEDVQKRVAQVVGNQRKTLPFIRDEIRRYHWLYTDAIDEQRFWGYTTPPATHWPARRGGQR